MLKPVDLQIFMNGTYVSVDLDRSTSFSFNLQATDLTNPTTVKIPFSAQIALPRTQNNDKLFSSIFKIDSVVFNYSPLKRTDFLLYVSGSIFQSGYFAMEEVTGKEYRIRLYGGLGDFFYTMSDVSDDKNGMRLSQLDFGDLFKHEINKEEVQRHWTSVNGGRTGTYYDHSIKDYRYNELILKYAMTYQGQYDNFDSDSVTGEYTEPVEVLWQSDKKTHSSPTLNEHYRSFKVGDGNDNEQYYGEYRSYYQRPAVLFKVLYNKILDKMAQPENGGWNIKLDPTFFNSYNPYWNDLWLICPQYNTNSSAAGFDIAVTNPSDNLSYEINEKGIRDFKATVGAHNELIEAGETYFISASIPFKVWAQHLGGSGEYAQDKRGNLKVSAEILVNGVRQITLKDIESPSQYILFNKDTVGGQTPHKLPNGTSFFYRKPDEGSGTTAEGSVWTLAGGFEYTAPMQGNPPKIEIKIILDGDTYWRRYKHGTRNRRYAAQIQIQEDAVLTIASRKDAGLRSDSEITFKNIFTSEESCFNFFMSYGKIFDLHYIKDEVRKEIEVLTRNSFFGKRERVDWSHKIDRSKEDTTKLVPFDYATGVFKWRDAGSKYEELTLSSTSKEYGSARFHTGNEFSDATQQYLDGILFDNCIITTDYSQYYLDREKTLYKDNKTLPYLQDASGNGIETAFIPVFYNGISESLKVPFAISDDTPAMMSYGYSWTDSDFVSCTTYPLFGRLKKGRDKVYSLDFGRSALAYGESAELTGDESSTLYARFWKGYLEDRFSENTRIKTCYVFLTPSDIQSNLFRKFIYIDNTVWVLSKISGYNPLSEGPTKVELVKVQKINSYVSQKYAEGNFVVKDSDDKVLYDGSGSEGAPAPDPLIIRVKDKETEINLQFQSVLTEWKIDGGNLPEGVSVNPLSHAASDDFIPVTITIPENGTGTTLSYFIRVEWGDSITPIQIASVSNWAVTATTNKGKATINGVHYPPPQNTTTVADGSNVTFACSDVDGYKIGYWLINGVYYYTTTVSLPIYENTEAKAFWYDASQYVLLVCNDASTLINGVDKINNYWMLTEGSNYKFLNSQYNLSGYHFVGDATFTPPAATVERIIKATDTQLTVYYDTLLANITVFNNLQQDFDLSNIIVSRPDGSHGDSVSGSVIKGTGYDVLYSMPSTQFGTYSLSLKESDNYKYRIENGTWNYSRGSAIPSIIVHLFEPDPVGWKDDEITTFDTLVPNELRVPAGQTFMITCDLSGVNINPALGVGIEGTLSQLISVTLPGKTLVDRSITVTALINSSVDKFVIHQRSVLNYIKWEKNRMAVSLEGGSLTNKLIMPNGYEYRSMEINPPGTEVTYTPASGNGDTEVTFTIPASETARNIDVSVSIYEGDTVIITRTFTINQS